MTHDPDHWRKRADEMRRIAEDITVVARAKASILRAAQEYDGLALPAEDGSKDAAPPPLSVGAEIMRKLHGSNIYDGLFSELGEDLQGWNSQHPIFSELIIRNR